MRAFIPPGYKARRESESPGKSKPNVIVDDLEIDDAVLEIGREMNRPLRFEVHHLKAGPRADKQMKFRLELMNPMPRGKLRVEGQFGPWRMDNIPETPVSGSYTLSDADLGVFSALLGTVSSAGEFGGVLRKIAVEGWIRSPNFEIRSSGHPVSLEGHLRADVNGTNGDVFLRDTSFSWDKTTLLAVGGITGRSDQKSKTGGTS